MESSEIDKERNRMTLERISFHLDEAMKFCNLLDLSHLSAFEQTEWNTKMRICKDAIEFTKRSFQELKKILE